MKFVLYVWRSKCGCLVYSKDGGVGIHRYTPLGPKKLLRGGLDFLRMPTYAKLLRDPLIRTRVPMIHEEQVGRGGEGDWNPPTIVGYPIYCTFSSLRRTMPFVRQG
jgi:hypothetical protein